MGRSRRPTGRARGSLGSSPRSRLAPVCRREWLKTSGPPKIDSAEGFVMMLGRQLAGELGAAQSPRERRRQRHAPSWPGLLRLRRLRSDSGMPEDPRLVTGPWVVAQPSRLPPTRASRADHRPTHGAGRRQTVRCRSGVGFADGRCTRIMVSP